MPMLRFGSALMVESNIDSKKWNRVKKTCKTASKGRVKVSKRILAHYSPEKYLLSHCSIIAAVDTELADPKNKKSIYYTAY